MTEKMLTGSHNPFKFNLLNQRDNCVSNSNILLIMVTYAQIYKMVYRKYNLSDWNIKCSYNKV